ncbi:MAG: PKD domain-containing protein [Chloroflexota bacterium]|nr:PKD domain-containing protein [Chloroflexota bacterium]
MKKLLALTFLIIIAVLTIGCANQAPIISELRASEECPITSGDYIIECLASDTDGDVLTYEWEADGGTISGKGHTATWTTPDTEGTYTITVTVRDAPGNEATRLLSLSVAANEPPKIEDVAVTAHNPEQMKDNKIFKGESCDIECVASDEDEDKLTYSWSCDRGNIQGSGEKISWTAPNTGCDATITVTVADGRGGTDSKEIVFEVVTCHCQLG